MSTTHIDGFPCSPQQTSIWRLALRHPTRIFEARVSAIVHASNAADVRHAVERVVTRHGALRTSLQALPGMTEPLQVADPCAIEWSSGELSPTSGAGLRASVVPAGQEFRLRLAAPAHMLDAESLITLIAEATTEIAGRPRSEGIGDSEHPIEYVDYAAWRNDLLASPDRAELREYWTRIALDTPPVSFAAAADSNAAGEAPLRASLPLSARVIDSLAGVTDSSAAAVLLAAWTITVARSIGARSLVIGHRFDGRFAEPIRAAVGRYAHYLPVRVAWEPGDRFADFVRAVDADLRQAAERQDYAPAMPSCAVGFALLDWVSDPVSTVAETAIEELCVEEHDMPLALSCVRGRDEYRATVSADSAAFGAARIHDLLARLRTLLRAAAEHANAAVDDLDLLPAEERHELIATLNKTDAPYPADALFDRLFEQQAARTPRHVAIRVGAFEMPYAELDHRASRLAGYLAHRGVAPGQLVPVVLPLTPDLLVGILGVLKAGAAYVAIDPNDPPQRIASLIADVAPTLVVTHAAVASRLPDGFDTVRLDGDPLEGYPEPGGAATRSSSDAAYVLYTSGSTGRPNGVQVPHRALVNYVTWCARAYGLAAGRGALVATSPAFDLTVTGLLAPLLVGQTVVLVENRAIEGLAEALLSADDYTLLKITPSQLESLQPLLSGARLEGRVRTLVLGGEALTAEMIADVRHEAPGTAIVNEYGPTETVVGCCAHFVTAEDRAGAIPIGRPIANVRVYVLDETGRPAPLGAPGELWIGGACVASGYVGREAVTAERFVESPFGPGRIYRTGDRVRYRDDRTLEFVGRADEELKVHGWRIHPREIECALDEHPGVQGSVVAVRPDTHGASRLAAFYVPRDSSHTIDEEHLRAHLLDRLPAAVVPSVFVPIASVPLNERGKRDLNALPSIDADRARQAVYAAPRGHEEEVIAAVWANVFRRDRIGIDENYFVLGGDSLRSVQVTALAQKRGIAISVAQIHRHPTIRELAVVARDGDPLVADVPPTSPFSLAAAEDRGRMSDDIEDAYPLNLLQEGMIYHREFSPKSAVYHAICSYRIRARFDLDLMRLVVEQLIARHPLLRTSFDLSTYSRPMQLVHRRFTLPFQFEDLRAQSAEAHDAAVDAWMAGEKQRGFDLDEYPLIRYSVHLLEDDVFQLSYSFHHEIIDGWSDAFMVTELLTHYLSALNGASFQPHVSTTTFRDSIALERKALETEAFREFWRHNLDGAHLMKLPRLISRPRADKGLREIVKIEVPVSEALSDAVKQLAMAHAVPVKTVLLAAHVRVMAAFGGGADVLTYTVSNGRPENRDGHEVIGLFVNSLAFRMRIPRADWKTLILDTLKTEHALLPYRRYPMAELKRQSGNEPLSETLFFFNHYHVADVLNQWESARLLGIKVYGESTFPYCINAYLAPVTKRLGMRIEYDSLQFPAELIDAMSESYLDVLNAMVADPAGRCDIVPSWQRRPTLAPAGPTIDFEPHDGLHRLCETAAAACPDSVAIVCDDQHVTYEALHARAAVIADGLRQRSVGAGMCVGLCLPGSMPMIAALLGVLKAGAAYVPIDPAYPAERIAYIAGDAPLALLVVDAGSERAVPAIACPVVTLDALLVRADEHAAPAASGAGALAGELACVIYTSGSTGRPKGTLVTHASLVHATQARLEYYGDRAERFLLLSPFVFDSSAVGLYWTLCDGGTLVLPPGGRAIDLSGLASALVDHEITHTLTIPSLYTAFLQQITALPSRALRTLIMAGESCPQALFDCHRRTAPDVRFFNEYGPTEATVWCTVAEASPNVLSPVVPIGRPIANTRTYVLDPFMQFAPVGVAGELCVSGPGLARGYGGRPDLTAERFVPDPFEGAGARMYRTGDLVRRLADGQLEFLNRVDAQVKINGFRIEPAEIELALEEHPTVQRSIVLLRESEAGEKRLVAYVLPARGQRIDVRKLAEFARGRLPKYMVPATWVALERLPLTATGKVDRAALPTPHAERPDLGRAAVPPRTPTEEIVAGIWREVLGVGTVGVFDEFFDLGGESLRAMRITARTRTVFQVDLGLDMLMTPGCTVARMAEAVEVARWVSRRPPDAQLLDGQYEVGTI